MDVKFMLNLSKEQELITYLFYLTSILRKFIDKSKPALDSFIGKLIRNQNK